LYEYESKRLNPETEPVYKQKISDTMICVSERELIWILHPDRSKGAEYNSRKAVIKELNPSSLAKKYTREVFTAKLSESCQKVLNTTNACSLLNS